MREKKSTRKKKHQTPHVWHNPQNGIQMVEAIRSNLEKVSPENAELYTNNAEKLTGEIKQIDSWIKKKYRDST
ncbi:MAG: metal ABC transporter substrate-binding protein [Rivularia sp. (in: cyanobacteria)]